MHIVASKSNFRQNATYALLPGQRRFMPPPQSERMHYVLGLSVRPAVRPSVSQSGHERLP